MPALPLDDAGPYVAGAYLVFLAMVLAYVAIMAAKLSRIERELVESIQEPSELTKRERASRSARKELHGSAPVLSGRADNEVSGLEHSRRELLREMYVASRSAETLGECGRLLRHIRADQGARAGTSKSNKT